MKVSEHFEFEEFLADQETLPEGILEKVTALCQTILEPVRVHFGKPLMIMSGYRSRRHNILVGGVPTSYHLYAGDHAAADFVLPGIPLDSIFDWIRLESHLPFDQVILERAKGRDDDVRACIHIQTCAHPRRMALIGETHGQGAYMRLEVA